MTPLIEPLGEFGFLVRWPGEQIDAAVVACVHALAAQLRARPPSGMLDIVPAYSSLGVLFEPELFIQHPDQPLSDLRQALNAAEFAGWWKSKSPMAMRTALTFLRSVSTAV